MGQPRPRKRDAPTIASPAEGDVKMASAEVMTPAAVAATPATGGGGKKKKKGKK